MADFNRPASFLPTIKCSSCNEEIEISMMGEHVCSSAPSARAPTEPTTRVERADPPPPSGYETSASGFLKPGRKEAPRIDSSAANRSFARQDLLTPSSGASSPRNFPQDGRISPYGSTFAKQRPATPPTPARTNLDCAFPPFPVASSMGPKSHREDLIHPDSNPNQPLPSPRFEAAGNALKRMNTIAPGPFGLKGRPREGTLESEGGGGSLQRNATTKDYTRAPSGGGKSHFQKPSGGSDLSGSSGSGSNRSTLARQMSDPRANNHARTDRAGGYGGLGTQPPLEEHELQAEAIRQEDWSQTYPTIEEGHSTTNGRSGPLPRRPSEPSRKRPTIEPPEMPYDQNRSVEPSRTIGRQAPAADELSRAANRSNPRNDPPKEVLRPVAFAALADEYSVGNPYHTPTESQSSNESDFSGTKTGSSRSSPPLSDTSSLAPRKGSKTANMDNVMNDLQNSFRNIQPTSDSHSGPKSTFVAPEYNRSATFPQPESPMDPSFPSRFGSKNAFNAPSTASPLRQAPQRAQTVSNKGFCKGCQEPIRGKSVSSADGRLTGRYHKHCFVCKSCRAPFETAEFYVLKDQPYCERHYHKLNNSLCQSCDQGIEGQYLETDRKQKFHPRCLSCRDCHQQLHEDYFELNGKIYCERDALRLAQRPTFPGSGRKNPERRTTRLMMMI